MGFKWTFEGTEDATADVKSFFSDFVFGNKLMA